MKQSIYWASALAGAAAVAAPAAAQMTAQIKPLSVRQVAVTATSAPRAGKVMMPDAKIGQKRQGGVAGWHKVDPRLIEAVQSAILAQKVADAIKGKLAQKSVGFAVTVIAEGGGKGYATGGLARSTPDSGQRAWKNTDRITIASASKSFTAAAMMRVMASKGVSLDDPVWKYLPSDWTFGSNFKTITIRELMSHRSGIRSGVGGCSIDFDGIKACAAGGVTLTNKFQSYDNANYALQRVMLPRIYGSTATTAEQYAKDYEVIVNRMVMNSAGIAYATCKAGAGNVAMSYESTSDNGDDLGPTKNAAGNFDWTSLKPGIDWGDHSLVCGSQGWNLSSEDLAKFGHALFFTGKILPQTTVDTMRSDDLGMFYQNFAALELDGWGHGGWHPAGWNQGEVNTWVFGFSNGLTVGLTINSRYKGSYQWDVAAGVREALGPA